MINVLRATPTISWANPADIVYGTALGGTQLDATASVQGTFTYTPVAGTVLAAGNDQTLSVSFAPSDTTDYTSASASVMINVLRATPTISWANPADIVYGTALSGTQLDATASVQGTFTYTPVAGTVLAAGNDQTLSVSFAPNDTTDYTSASASVMINVLRATPTISWANPADIVYGTALSGTQLDATASVQGTFTYTPVAGTVLAAGNDQTLSVSFAPSDTTDYTSASASVMINVLRATPTISWANPADIVYGTALSGTQLDATASVQGTFTYTPVAGTVLAAGNDQTLSVSFAPNDTTDYTIGFGHRDDQRVAERRQRSLGRIRRISCTAPPSAVLSSTRPQACRGPSPIRRSRAPFWPLATTRRFRSASRPPTRPITPRPRPSVTINVLRATPTIAWANPADIVYGTALSGTQLDATANVVGTYVHSGRGHRSGCRHLTKRSR